MNDVPAARREQAPPDSRERAQAILEERARLLARVPSREMSRTQLTEVLLFGLGKERFALATTQVHEVLRCKEFTPLPETPDFLVGITNLRGQILPLFDLGCLFALGAPAATPPSWLIVMGQERPEAGVLVDAIHEVARLRTEEILDPPEADGKLQPYLRGVTAAGLILLDGGRLLDHALCLDTRNDLAPPGVREDRG
jgi:purine-binding chemotaxis protein CheW